MPETWCIKNFGRNIFFTPDQVRTPQTEDDLREILDHGRKSGIRVGGSLHAWSDGAATHGIFVDMWPFAEITVTHQMIDGFRLVTVGAGCRLDAFLEVIRRHGLTLPTIGTIARQTVAGAVSTGTHGSGRPSLSHFIHKMRIAAYDPAGEPHINDWTAEDALRVLRCGVGCTGIIVSVTFKCVPLFQVVERVRMHDSLSSVLPVADDALDEFALVPYLWKYVGYHRTVPACEAPVKGTGWWIGWPWRAMYRAYKLVVIDCVFHLVLKTVLAAHVIPRWGSKFADWMTKVVFLGTKLMVQPGIWLTSGQGVVDDSQPALTRKHYLFRHVEMEVFVPGRRVREATAMLQAIVEVFAGVTTIIPEPVRTQLARAGLLEQLLKDRGCYMHHYPLYFRRVLPDATAISMTSGADEPCYAIGIFCYRGQKRSFYAFARFVAVAMMRVFSARLHWGKYLPMFPQPAVTSRDFEDVYPNLPAFRDWCLANVDPEGVFQNEYTHRVFGFARPDPPRRRKTAVPSLYTVGSTPAGSSPGVRLETREGAEPT